MSRPEGRFYLPLMIGAGLSVAALGGMLLVLTLGSLIGPFRFCAAPNATPFALAEAPPRIEVLDPRPEMLVATRVDVVGPARLRVRATNDGDEPVRAARVRVEWFVPARRVTARPTKIGQPNPPLAFASGAESVDLEIPELDAGESVAYTLDLE